MNKIKNDLYNDFWDWLDSISIKYKNYEIKNTIIAYKYLQYFQLILNVNCFNLRRFLSSIRWKLKLNLLMGKMPKQKMFLKRNYDLIHDLSHRNLYTINLPPNDSRNFLHIGPLAENDINSLVVTSRRDVHEYFNKLGIQSILLDIYNPWRKIEDLKIQIPRVRCRKNLLFSLDTFSLLLLLRAASLIDLLDILANKKGLPRALITHQDFDAFDSVFATYFKDKIPTITLQHGMASIPKGGQNSLWKYLISDWMVVFGTRQAEILKYLGVNPGKIKILGTAKYDMYSYLKYDRQTKRNKRILVSIQPLLSKLFIETLFNFLEVLLKSKDNFLLSIRFHLGVNKKERDKFIRRLKKMNLNSFSKKNLEISKIKDPLEDISKSAIILVSRSTLGMEAMLLKKPIIEYLSLKKVGIKKFDDYRDFALHASTGEEAKDLITKLLNDSNFYKKIVEKQNKSISSEIMSPPAIPRILNFINNLNNKEA